MVITRRRPVAVSAAMLCIAALVAGCSDDTAEEPTASGSLAVPQLKAADFTVDFKQMEQLKDIAAAGEGMIGVLLPDTTTSTRYVQYDAPYLKQAFEAAGLSADQFKIDNAQGSASTMQQLAEADINAGASVLLVDPVDQGSGAAIENSAAAAGVKVIDYDRLVTGGPADRYYVSFNNVQVGNLIGQGEVDCIAAWNVSDPNILVLNGAPTDNNALLFNQGYMEVLQPKFEDKTYTKSGEPAGTWSPSETATTFEAQLADDPDINAVVTANDDNANAVISVLKKEKIEPRTFPTTGQDASLPGLQNILTGYQCGTVYKPVYAEAQAAAALALMLRAGVTPPTTLVSTTTRDTTINADIASVYTVPVWVTSENMADTVVKDKAVEVSELCSGEVAQACEAAGIG